MRNISLDFETTKAPTLHPWQKGAFAVAVGITDEQGGRRTWVLNHKEADPGGPSQRTMLDEVQEEINKADRIVGANLKFDMNWMTHLGLDFSHCQLWCTQVTEYLLRGNVTGDLSLAALSKYYGIPEKIDLVKAFWDSGYETTEVPLHILIPYLEQDCINALVVFQKQLPRVIDAGMWALHCVEMEAMRVLSEIELNGMRFDVEYAKAEISRMQTRLAELDAELHLAFDWDVNLDSGDELSVALFGGKLNREGLEWVTRELKYSTKYYQRKAMIETVVPGVGFTPDPSTQLAKDGYYSTDRGNLSRLHGKGLKLKRIKEGLMERSVLAKALETFMGKDEDGLKGLINKVQEDGCLHGQLNQSITKTGRLSGSSPNLQNLPREGTSPLKVAIIPRNDKIAGVDFSQAEWRGAAHLSQDPVMLHEIRNNVDPHRENAIEIFKANPESPKFKEVRTTAKISTFRLLYGGTAFGFYMDEDMPRYSRKEWARIVDAFWEKYTGLKAWQDKNYKYVIEHGGKLPSVTGRYFMIGKDLKGTYKRRNVCNYPVQAIATADFMKLAMVLVYRAMKRAKMQTLIIGQVHDSLVFDAVEKEIPALMKMTVGIFRNLGENIEQVWGIKLTVPLDADFEVGPNYGQMEKLSDKGGE